MVISISEIICNLRKDQEVDTEEDKCISEPVLINK